MKVHMAPFSPNTIPRKDSFDRGVTCSNVTLMWILRSSMYALVSSTIFSFQMIIQGGLVVVTSPPWIIYQMAALSLVWRLGWTLLGWQTSSWFHQVRLHETTLGRVWKICTFFSLSHWVNPFMSQFSLMQFPPFLGWSNRMWIFTVNIWYYLPRFCTGWEDVKFKFKTLS